MVRVVSISKQVYQTLNPRYFPLFLMLQVCSKSKDGYIFTTLREQYIIKKKKKIHVLQEYTCKVHSCDLNFSLRNYTHLAYVPFCFSIVFPKAESVPIFPLFLLSGKKTSIYLSKWGFLLPLLLNFIYVIPISSLPIQKIGCFQCDPIKWDISAKQHSLIHCTYLLTHASFPIRL